MVNIIPLESLESLVYPEAMAGLKSYLGNVETGFDEMLETPFSSGNPRAQAEEFYASIAKSSIPELNELELDEVDRFGPYSVRLPWSERKAGVLEYLNQGTIEKIDTCRIMPPSSLV